MRSDALLRAAPISSGGEVIYSKTRGQAVRSRAADTFDPRCTRTSRMGDFAGWITQFSREALDGDNRALLGLALAGIFVGFAMTRRKLSGWMLVPILAGAVWYGLIRWVQLKNG